MPSDPEQAPTPTEADEATAFKIARAHTVAPSSEGQLAYTIAHAIARARSEGAASAREECSSALAAAYERLNGRGRSQPVQNAWKAAFAAIRARGSAPPAICPSCKREVRAEDGRHVLIKNIEGGESAWLCANTRSDAPPIAQPEAADEFVKWSEGYMRRIAEGCLRHLTTNFAEQERVADSIVAALLHVRREALKEVAPPIAQQPEVAAEPERALREAVINAARQVIWWVGRGEHHSPTGPEGSPCGYCDALSALESAVAALPAEQPAAAPAKGPK